MYNDCALHKLGRIVSKSISRFGRNTVDTLKAINTLREFSVDVYFESENIHTEDRSSDLILTCMESAAQRESVEHSENIKWSLRKSIENGSSKIFSRKCFGYCQDENANLVIDEAEAVIVRDIFNMYLGGYSIVAIVQELEPDGGIGDA